MLYLSVAFNLTREALFIVLAIAITIFTFNTRSYIDTIRDLKVKTHFTVDYENYKVLNVIEKALRNDPINEYEVFFKIYDLYEGNTFSDSNEIENYFTPISRSCLVLIILLIVFIILSLISFIAAFKIKEDSRDYQNVHPSLVFCIVSTIREVILFLMFFEYFGFFIAYKRHFEKGFFELYDNINNNEVKILFENYYISLFDLKLNYLVNIIFQSINLFIGLIYTIIFLNSADCCKRLNG
jgi:hypothetical protein